MKGLSSPVDLLLLWIFLGLCVALVGLFVLIVRDVIRHRRHQAELAAQDKAALPNRTPICTHGIAMTEKCPHCTRWLQDHGIHIPENPRRG